LNIFVSVYEKRAGRFVVVMLMMCVKEKIRGGELSSTELRQTASSVTSHEANYDRLI
jgi:hypothetical protein